MNKLIKVILFLIVGMVQAFAWGGLRGDTLAKELPITPTPTPTAPTPPARRATGATDHAAKGHVSLEQDIVVAGI